MRRICASLNNHNSDNSSTSSATPLNQAIAASASDLMGPEPSLALAEALRYAQKESQSVEHYWAGIEIGRDIGNRDSELWCWLGLACAHLQIREREKAENALNAARDLTTDPGFTHPLEAAHVGLIEALARVLSKSPVNLQDVLQPYADLGIGWPEQFISETHAKGELPRAIPI